MTTDNRAIAIREVPFGSLGVAMERRVDCSIIVRSTEAAPRDDERLTDRLQHWARVAPDRTFLAKRDASGNWRKLSYGETWAQVRRLATALLQRRLSPDRPIVILSGNDLEHALLALAAMLIGQPYAPISPAYSLISSDYGKLRSILGSIAPQLAFAANGDAFAKAITTCCAPSIEVVTATGQVPGRNVTLFAALLSDTLDAGSSAAIDAAAARVTPDTIAKVLFTSGSTGTPKGVITTHRMLSANQAMIRHWAHFVVDEPPVLVDWLPWNHVFGGSHNFGLVLTNGGTLYIDGGRPVPGGFAETLRNLREIAPTIYFNVPKGYEELVAAMREDAVLRETFFSKLRLTFYSGASLPRHIADELDAHAERTTAKRILMVTGFGSTETAPAAIVNTHRNARLGNVGVPLPGVAIKLVPSGEKLEARIQAPSVMPGYWRDAPGTSKAFDSEGYYCFGDAFRFADADNAEEGLIFDGRVSEDFKLSTGTWVSVGPLRARLIAALAPFAKDVVIAGHDRGFVTALVFPDFDPCGAYVRETGAAAVREQTTAALLSDARLIAEIQRRLIAFARDSSGSSTRIARLILLDELPSIDAGEITDKGSINQRVVLMRRAGLVEALYAAEAPQAVIAADL